MAINNNHIIRQLRWESTFDDQKHGFDIQNRLSNWTQTQLLREANHVFGKFCPEELTLRIDSLELDLGEVPKDEMEISLAKRFREALWDQLKEVVRSANRGKTVLEIIDEETSQLRMLNHFLRSGLMPWTHTAGSNSVNQILALQLKTNQKALVAMLRIVGLEGETRKRMAWQFNEPNIKGIIEGLEPNNHTQIIRFSDELEKIQQKENIIQISSRSFKKSVWTWIITHLLIRRGAIFNRYVFARDTLTQMANHYNIKYVDLLNMIREAMNRIRKTSYLRAELFQVLDFLIQEYELGRRHLDKGPTPSSIQAEGNRGKMRDIRFLDRSVLMTLVRECLVDGRLSWKDEKVEFQLKDLLITLLKTYPAELRKLVQEVRLSSIQVDHFRAAVPFSTFCEEIFADQSNHRQGHLHALRQLQQIIMDHSAFGEHDPLQSELWEMSLQIVALHSWPEGRIDQWVDKMVLQLSQEMGLASAELVEQITATMGTLSPVLARAFSRIKQSASKRWADPTNDPSPTALQQPNRLSQPKPNPEKEALDQSEAIPINRKKPHSFQDLITEIKALNRSIPYSHSDLMHFYAVLPHFDWKGIPIAEVQAILYRQVLKAWQKTDWARLAPMRLWNELIWELSQKRGMQKQDFFERTAVAAHLLPAPFQVAFSHLYNKEIMPAPEILAERGADALANHLASGIPIRNAGLVLLNSYFQILFERLDLVVEKAFRDPDSQYKGAHSLQFMATGVSKSEEASLPLNKLLCGIPMTHPIPDTAPISKEDIDLIESLISAAISYWPAIGKTSVNGFRGNWLVREGILSELPDRWELNIEKKAFDLLIDRSPFSFSIIKYPWMSKALHVNWAY